MTKLLEKLEERTWHSSDDSTLASKINELISRENQREASKEETPMGASQWKAHGLKYGYWNFFETEIRKDYVLKCPCHQASPRPVPTTEASPTPANTPKEGWIKEFDELFTRIDQSDLKRGYMDKWFVRDTVISADVKSFIRTNFINRKALREKVEKKVRELEITVGNQEKGENTVAIGKRIQELHWVLSLIDKE